MGLVKTKELRISARADEATKQRLLKALEKYPKLTESDAVLYGLELLLPKMESGKFNPFKQPAAVA